MSLFIFEPLSAKRRGRSKWQRSRYPSDRCHFEDLARELRNELSIFRAANYDTYVSSLSPKNRSLWTATTRLLNYHSIPSPLLRQDNSWARCDEEKVEVSHSHISSIFHPFPDTDPVHTSQVYEYLDSPLPLSLPPRSFTPSEVSFIISRLPNRKPPIYISDIPTYPTTHMATFADDICILTSHPDPLSVSESLQDHLDNLHSWCKRWRIRINQSKSVHLSFTLRRQSCPPLSLTISRFLQPTMSTTLGCTSTKGLLGTLTID
ncbi:hypothetical protein AAG570_006947 [Ranatra chinensis]|uniref:Reverse transcriptase domain-containing protein n=1 Tax=Ranatra chinensis TaxID=642074 RepID=A0ABD0YVJ1_9HEMI